MSLMSPAVRKTLACGCQADTTRDFLGRVVGTIVAKGEGCSQALHVPGRVVVMPGREHARQNGLHVSNDPNDPNGPNDPT
jgi:hypothetical protein